MGGLAGGAQTLAETGDPKKAWDAVKGGALFGGAASAAPLVTAGGLGAAALTEPDPYRQAQLGTSALALGVPSAIGMLQGPGKALENIGQDARERVSNDVVKEQLPAAVKQTEAENAQAAKDLKARFKLLQKSVEGVNDGPSAPGTPGTPAAEDLAAIARGKLGAEAQENYRYLRSKGDLGLNLNPEAQQGVQALLPDYEAQANENLGRFAQGKEARLKQILATLEAERAAAGTPGSPGATGTSPAAAFFQHPELLPTTGTLKPNPLAGFEPKPIPTAEDLAPKLAPEVQARINEMKAQRGIGSRLAAGALKGGTSLGGMLLGGGGFAAGHGEAGFLGAAGLGVAKALQNDPVLATKLVEPVGRGMQAAATRSKAIANFLGTSTGPVLAKKIEFLNKYYPGLVGGQDNEQR